MIVGDGHGSDAGRRSQLRPAQQMKLSLSSSGFLFGPPEVGNLSHTNSKSVVGFQPTEDVLSKQEPGIFLTVHSLLIVTTLVQCPASQIR